MAKYIDADKLLNRINAQKLMALEPVTKRIIGFINEAATENVAPVRHGKWLHDDDKIICSECKTYWYKWDDCEACIEGFVYCPNCGAKLDGEEIK